MIKWLLTRAVEDDNVRSGYDLVYTPNITREELFKISGHLPLYEANQYPPMAAGARGSGRRALSGQADELPDARSHLQEPAAELSRPADPALRSRQRLPQRASGVAARAAAGARTLAWTTPTSSAPWIRSKTRSFSASTRWTGWCGRPSASSSTSRSRPARPSGWATTRSGIGRRRCSSARWSGRGSRIRIDEGGGAFYGPKIDIKFRDAIGRLWQGPTIQLDFNLPERFELEYTGADNRPHRPVMIHRAIYGTLERFIGNLIEHFAGAFPVWLAPEQVRVIPISDAQADAAPRLGRAAQGRRAPGARGRPQRDARTTGSAKARLQKVPYMAVIGQREAESDSLALRVRGAGKKQEVMPVSAFIERVTEEVRTRLMVP